MNLGKFTKRSEVRPVEIQKGRLAMEYLPPYAPELNPVEYIWAHCKHHELPNVCAKNLWDLGEGARRSRSGCAADLG
jgi:transposase